MWQEEFDKKFKDDILGYGEVSSADYSLRDDLKDFITDLLKQEKMKEQKTKDYQSIGKSMSEHLDGAYGLEGIDI